MKRPLSRWLFIGLCLCFNTVAALGATHNVSVANFAFTPSVLNITNGDTVVWTLSGGTHTVSPRAGVTEPFCGAASSCSRVFTNNGSFAYQCNFHFSSFNMTGQVNVVAAPGVPPT